MLLLPPYIFKSICVQVDDLLAVASVNFANGFSTSLADCWTAIVRLYIYIYASNC